jgi:hypothetical protein
MSIETFSPLPLNTFGTWVTLLDSSDVLPGMSPSLGDVDFFPGGELTVFLPAGVRENSLWREAGIPVRKYKSEQIVTLLRQVEVGIANGKNHPTSLQRSRDYHPDLLPLAERVRRVKTRSSQTTQGTGTRECEVEGVGGGAVFGEANSERRCGGKLLSPERRRGAVRHVRGNYRISERHACQLLGQWRGTQRYEVLYRTDEDALTRDIVALASEYERYGYRRITASLQARAGR